MRDVWEGRKKREGGRGEGGRERREVGGEEQSQCATSHNHETSTPVRPCPPAGYGTLAHGSTPPSQMLYIGMCEMGRVGGRRREEEVGRERRGGREGKRSREERRRELPARQTKFSMRY